MVADTQQSSAHAAHFNSAVYSLAGASTIDEASLVLQEFLSRFNARFSVAAEQPETVYCPVPDELSLTETICLKDTRKVARDNTVKYQWRVLQLLPGAERPSYAGLRVEVLERADGELMLRYQGKAVDNQEGPPPSSALWGADTGCSPDPEFQKVADGVAGSHLDEAQRERMATLESSAEEAAKRPGGKAKPVRHQLHRTPTPTQQTHWEAVQQARVQGFPPPGHSPEPGHGQEHRGEVRRGRRSAHQETQRQGACQGRGSGRITNGHRLSPGDIFAFQKWGRNRWTTTNLAGYMVKDDEQRHAATIADGAVETYIARVPEMPCALCGVWYMGLWGTLGILWLRRRFTEIRGLA